MLGGKRQQTKNPKCLLKNVNSVWIIGFTCILAIIQIMPSATPFHLSFEGDEDVDSVNITIKNKPTLDISITVDSKDSRFHTPDKKESICESGGTTKRIETTEQMENSERIETTDQIGTTTSSNPKDLILQAIKRDDEDETKTLILTFYNTLNGDENLRPLAAAAERCKLKVVRMLIENGADLNIRGGGGWSPIHVAAYNDCEEIVIELIDHGADINAETFYGHSALDIAAQNGLAKIAELLSHAVIDPSGEAKETALKWAESRGHEHVVNVLTTNRSPTTAESESSTNYPFESFVEHSGEGSGEEWYKEELDRSFLKLIDENY